MRGQASPTDILYGVIPPRADTGFSLSDKLGLESLDWWPQTLDINQLNFAEHGPFENVQGYSGNYQWLVKSTMIPEEWRQPDDDISTSRLGDEDVKGIIYAIQSASRESASLCQPSMYVGDEDYCQVLTPDDGQHIFSRHQMAAIVLLSKEPKGQWWFFSGPYFASELVYLKKNGEFLGSVSGEEDAIE